MSTDKFANMEKEAKGYFRNHPDVPSDPIRKLITLGAGTYKVRSAIRLIVGKEAIESAPVAALRHHVSGAIARGKAEAIVEQPVGRVEVEESMDEHKHIMLRVKTDSMDVAEQVFLAIARSQDCDFAAVTVEFNRGFFTYGIK